MNFQNVFAICAVVFTVGNLAAMGLDLNVRAALGALRSVRFVVLSVVFGWVIGPAFAVLLTRVVPLTEPYAQGLLLVSLAPCAPFYPLVVRRAKGDMAYAAAFVPLAALGTVVLMPLMLPMLIKGLTISTWAIAKPLLTLVLTPLVVGVAIRVYTAAVADRVLPAVKRIASIFTLLVLVLALVLYGRGMLEAVGSYAIGTQALFLLGITVGSYMAGAGLKLKQNQCSVLALGMGTRNIAAAVACVSAIPNPDPHFVVMVVLVIPLSVVIPFTAARYFAARAGGSGTGSAGQTGAAKGQVVARN
jgi:bile acid:Na+ symporter, BASS family